MIGAPARRALPRQLDPVPHDLKVALYVLQLGGNPAHLKQALLGLVQQPPLHRNDAEVVSCLLSSFRIVDSTKLEQGQIFRANFISCY